MWASILLLKTISGVGLWKEVLCYLVQELPWELILAGSGKEQRIAVFK